MGAETSSALGRVVVVQPASMRARHDGRGNLPAALIVERMLWLQ